MVALLGIVACEPQPTTTPMQSLLLSADKSEITADGADTATFDVRDAKGNITDATIYFAETNEALEGNSFKTKYAGEYKFYAKNTNGISNEYTIFAKETSDTPEPPQPSELFLSVDKNTIDADGVSVATFTSTLNGEVVDAAIYNADDLSSVEGNTFSTETPGIYKFYASYKEYTSNEVQVTAKMVIVEEEKPITLEASLDTIRANGVESSTLMVIQDGANVTSKATIYVNGGVMNGNKFTTTTPGTYTIYAIKGSQTSNTITITATEVQSGKTIVFADGVTLTSGWYDVNKKGAGDNGDINMCWAAAASNMIQWFQDRYKAAGNSLPAGAIDGPGTKYYGNYNPYELALMELYHDGWDNNKGGHVEQAIPWYFENKLYGGEYASAGSQAVPLVEGGFWKSIWSDVVKHMYCGYDYFSYDTFTTAYTYTVCYNNYNLWGMGSNLQGQERLAYVSDLIVRAFEHGMASLTVSLSADIMSLHHAVTLWGYEIDNATGLLTRIWITDSDDLMSEPKSAILNEYTVSIGSGNSHPKFTGTTRYGSIYLVSIHPFSGYKATIE